jgi:hypothetical protein
MKTPCGSSLNSLTQIAARVDMRSVTPTFGELLQRTQDTERRAPLLHNAQQAINAIHQFQGRIGDTSIRTDLQRKAAQLEESLPQKCRHQQKFP